jgi:putative PIN family toxin of toxin-antitoxin system
MNYRIGVDTNVIVSAIINPKGKPAALLDGVVGGELLLVVSDAILEEVQHVFSYTKIKKLLNKQGVTQREINMLLQTLSDISFFVPGKLELNIVESDPEDNKFIACAVEGNADFLISGDHHLIELNNYENIQILTPTDLANLVLSRFRG